MEYGKLTSKIEDFFRSIITPEFMEDVERWSKYKGETLHGCHVSLKDKGTFKKITMLPKMDWITDENGIRNFVCDKNIQEPYITLYDVSIVHSSSRCTKNDSIVIISERKDLEHRRTNLFIYSIAGSGKGTKYQPSFNQLKKDFETGKFKQYNSLLYNFCDVYTVHRYNETSDRVCDFLSIVSDLQELNDEFQEEGKKIHVTKRELNKFREYKK